LKTAQPHLEFTAPRDDNARLANLCGPLDENLRQIEQALDVTLQRRGHRITIRGRGAKLALTALENFYNNARDPLSVDDIQLALVEVRHPARHRTNGNGNGDEAGEPGFPGNPDHPFDQPADLGEEDEEELGPKLYTRRADLRGRTPAQREYLKQIVSHDVTFGVGPAGTGKTYLAVAKAVQALQAKRVNRIILTRPAVEAGERLGFLPGTLNDKIDPYLRPLMDALHDMLDPESVPRLLQAGTIEVAPLAYMRGRTLNDAFVILDEAQNTTPEQMKMFLTRLGFGSKIVVTGDITQVDLPNGTKSGLRVVRDILSDVEDIEFAYLDAKDVVRHQLVGNIVEAYSKYDDAI
jgi:phosphate starvation-inducible PhoH-like protein